MLTVPGGQAKAAVRPRAAAAFVGVWGRTYTVRILKGSGRICDLGVLLGIASNTLESVISPGL